MAILKCLVCDRTLIAEEYKTHKCEEGVAEVQILYVSMMTATEKTNNGEEVLLMSVKDEDGIVYNLVAKSKEEPEASNLLDMIVEADEALAEEESKKKMR